MAEASGVEFLFAGTLLAGETVNLPNPKSIQLTPPGYATYALLGFTSTTPTGGVDGRLVCTQVGQPDKVLWEIPFSGIAGRVGRPVDSGTCVSLRSSSPMDYTWQMFLSPLIGALQCTRCGNLNDPGALSCSHCLGGD